MKLTEWEAREARGQHNLKGQGYGVPRTLLTIPKTFEDNNLGSLFLVKPCNCLT